MAPSAVTVYIPAHTLVIPVHTVLLLQVYVNKGSGFTTFKSVSLSPHSKILSPSIVGCDGCVVFCVIVTSDDTALQPLLVSSIVSSYSPGTVTVFGSKVNGSTPIGVVDHVYAYSLQVELPDVSIVVEVVLHVSSGPAVAATVGGTIFCTICTT